MLTRDLSYRYRLIVVDQRGHGALERHPRDVSRAAYVADVTAVVDHLALRRPVLVGQSLDGHTAVLVSTRFVWFPIDMGETLQDLSFRRL
ncbi:alpha/beta hydrolase [Streptomyces sp. NPDC005799]|uniref:alpha/beta fold hydrolase n=1 Tax=Streptomyces sp. NPDC005799 TaxID=3154678 RepID=UPI0033C3997F